MKKVYTIKQAQFIKTDLATIWEFFSTPANLAKITPPSMNFVTLQITGGSKMYAGQLISYKVTPLPMLRVRWTSEIKNVSDQKYFTDEQKLGPFAMWHHQHFFSEKDGGVEMTDEVSYVLPFGWLGRLANRLIVGRQVKNIFEFRRQAVEKIFHGNNQNK